MSYMVWFNKLEEVLYLFGANISERYGRRYRGEYIRFLNIAQGSVNELETHLILSHRVGLCSEKDVEMILNLLKEESRMIISLIKKLEN
jgi:four helix bundle protein